ncbi:MAG: type IIA DNA topoisomerase subunit B [Bacteroidales bacterium]|nr:type IIA DNA topoisomerase subunit B [Bacteroidales bacterium]
MSVKYSEDTIKTLEWQEHIRQRPGMYIGKLGNGETPDDGIYVLLKEVMDNSLDEYMMGFGKEIKVEVTDEFVKVRDYGRGIPLGKVKDVASKMNTGAKYDSTVFKKSVGLNGVGIKAVNALSTKFKITAFREGEKKVVEFEKGILTNEHPVEQSDEKNGTETIFIPDESLFLNYKFRYVYIEQMIKNYVFLNAGLKIKFNKQTFFSKDGLIDFLNDKISTDIHYPIVHLKADDIEIAFTHGVQYGEEYYSFVNGQYTIQGGSHLQAFKEAYVKVIRDFYKKEFHVSDIRSSIIAAVSIKVEEPVFESQTKTRLGSKEMSPNGVSVRNFIMDFLGKYLDDYLHKHEDTANNIYRIIQDSEKERKAISSIKKIAKQRSKKVSLHNKKLRDCDIHYNTISKNNEESTLFITEGDSASGSITKSRDVNTQAVFSLRGKPLNTFGLTKKVIYENEEFNLLQAALNIEEGIENLRYNKVVIATDADVDGMHIRLLLITFFLNFFPDLIKQGHLHVLQTPLFRVRNKQKTIYCYSEHEKDVAIAELGKTHEITRFKGLGEISPGEFKYFIGDNIRLEPVILNKEDSVNKMLDFYMGKNTPQRQDFIIENLRVEEEY